jgi:hypothetical protein
MEILKAIVTTTTIRIMLLRFLGINLGNYVLLTLTIPSANWILSLVVAHVRLRPRPSPIPPMQSRLYGPGFRNRKPA